MVCGARSGSSSGRRMSSGRGFSVASGSGQFTPPPPTVPEQSSIHASFGRGMVSISMDDHRLIKF
ncbi:hypothetical protein Taro_025702 [Colocasia esculenta]|uniref:Uncharacterized protein n=1 Tax=Colocasia esculenta TaxID=4460 RepID=A0A843VLA4_COLES|nr:hypothetical protein [Colocasia esculenta]